MTQRKPKEPVAWLYPQAMRNGDAIERTRIDHSWLKPDAEHEHDYIQGQALVLQSEWEPRVLLANERQARVYIAGPMTGLPEYNFPAFNDAEAKLRYLGFEVENPASNGVVEDATWADYMTYAIGLMMRCNTIFLLPGWSKSKGASIERNLAEALGMTILGAEE